VVVGDGGRWMSEEGIGNGLLGMTWLLGGGPGRKVCECASAGEDGGLPGQMRFGVGGGVGAI
jgi:hypothetical protein